MAIPEWADCRRTAGGRQRNRLRPLLDSLEPRCLLTSISETAVFVSGSQAGDPTQLTFGPDGNLWYTEPSANLIGVFDTGTSTVVKQVGTSVTDGDPPGIAATPGPGGAVWFTLTNSDVLGELSPTDTSPALYIGYRPEINGSAVYVPSAGITAVGNSLWITVPDGNFLETLPAGTTLMTAYPLSPANIDVPNFQSQITSGPDETLWFTEPGGLGIFSLTSNTVIGQVSLPTSGGTQMPAAITVGPDGNIWFTESVPNSGSPGFASSAVGVIDVHNANAITEFATPAASQPSGITAGPDGNVWFTETAAGAIGFVNVAGLSGPGKYNLGRSIPIPTTGEAGGVLSNPAPVGITAGSDDTLWFADESGAIGVVNLTQFVVTSEPPSSVTAGKGFGFTVTAEDSSGNVDTQFNGNVTVSLASNPGGAKSTLGGSSLTMQAVNGVAAFSGLTLDIAAAGYTLLARSSASDAPTLVVPTSALSVVPAAVTKLLVTDQPPPSVPTDNDFELTVVAEDQFGNVATNYSGLATVSVATNAGGGGTALSGPSSLYFSPSSASPGFVTFNGLSLNNVGTGYVLKISLSPSVSTSTSPFNVTVPPPPAPPPPPPPSSVIAPTIASESVVINQKVNNKGKKTGKPILSGYTITFSMAMDGAALGNSGNYVVATNVIKTQRVKVGTKTVKKKVSVPQPIGFAVTNVTSNSVTLTLAGKQKFAKGGLITINAAPPGGVDSTSSAFLAQNGILAISPSGKGITLVS